SGYLRAEECGLAEGFIPFAGTKAERMAFANPWSSLEERCSTPEADVANGRNAAQRMVERRFLLPAGVGQVVREVESSDVWRLTICNQILRKVNAHSMGSVCWIFRTPSPVRTAHFCWRITVPRYTSWKLAAVIWGEAGVRRSRAAYRAFFWA